MNETNKMRLRLEHFRKPLNHFKTHLRIKNKNGSRLKDINQTGASGETNFV